MHVLAHGILDGVAGKWLAIERAPNFTGDRCIRGNTCFLRFVPPATTEGKHHREHADKQQQTTTVNPLHTVHLLQDFYWSCIHAQYHSRLTKKLRNLPIAAVKGRDFSVTLHCYDER